MKLGRPLRVQHELGSVGAQGEEGKAAMQGCWKRAYSSLASCARGPPAHQDGDHFVIQLERARLELDAAGTCIGTLSVSTGTGTGCNNE
jgi:hypothetical protein